MDGGGVGVEARAELRDPEGQRGDGDAVAGEREARGQSCGEGVEGGAKLGGHAQREGLLAGVGAGHRARDPTTGPRRCTGGACSVRAP